MLFPCGHTFCAACLSEHTARLRNSTCPFCRERIGSQAPNVSLQQVIEAYVERQGRMQRGETLDEIVQGQEAAAAAVRTRAIAPALSTALASASSASVGSAANPSSGSAGNPIGGAAEQLERYSEQYRAYSIRCRVLANQRDEAKAEQAEVSESRKTSASVLRALRGEEEEATRRLEAIRHELEVLRAQTAEQARDHTDSKPQLTSSKPGVCMRACARRRRRRSAPRWNLARASSTSRWSSSRRHSHRCRWAAVESYAGSCG